MRYIDAQEPGRAMPTMMRREEAPSDRRPAIDNVDDFLVDRGPSWRWPFGALALDSGPLGALVARRWSLRGRWLARDAGSRDLL